MRWPLVAILVGLALGCDGRRPYAIDLTSEHRFHIGDDPWFADASFDDSGWQRLGFPATWRVRTFRSKVVAWHRFHFDVAAPVPGPLALEVGLVGWSDEVFLNGQRIGGTGTFDRMPRLGPAWRLYQIPEGALRVGHNVVAIRIRGLPFGVSGLHTRHIGIGDAVALERARDHSLSTTRVAEGMLFGFLGLSWVLIAFFPKRGRPGRAAWWLLGSISLAVVLLWLLSTTTRELGLSPDVPASINLGIVGATGTMYWAFVATIVCGAVPRPLQLIIAIALAFAVGLMTWSAAFTPLMMSGALIGVGTATYIGWLVVGAIRAHTPGAIPMAISCVVGVASLVAMLVAPLPMLLGLPFIYYGIVFSIALGVLALIRHVYEMDVHVQRVTRYALDAHTRERGRLARDLHDGLGQMLAVLKLQMQRMGKKHEGEPVQQTFDETAEQVAATIDEMRRIARDLRPAPMQGRGFGDAVREYALAMTHRTGLQVEVEGEYRAELAESVGDELYRVLQECLTNCLKHSSARRVVVTLGEFAERHQLVVSDDGKGLSTERASGLGLATIRERAELLGGSATITSSAAGTRVEVTIPR